MNQDLTCPDVEAALFELSRDELADVKRTEVEEHLSRCTACSALAARIAEMFGLAADDVEALVEVDSPSLFERIKNEVEETKPSAEVDAATRLDDMFDVARSAEIDSLVSIDSDALFGRVSEEISEQAEIVVLEQVEEQVVEDDAVELREGRRGRLFIFAAAACAALVGWWVVSTQDEPAASPPAEERLTSSDSPDDRVPSEEKRSAPSAEVREVVPAPSIALPEMRPVSSDDAVRIFASADAHYELVGATEGTTELTDGSMLVEYLPESKSDFSILARGHRVTVVGTVFFTEVDGDEVNVAVFEGAVEVTNPDGSVVELARGQFLAGGEGGELTPSHRGAVATYVDLDEHRRALSENRADVEVAVAPQVDEPAPADPEPPVVEARTESTDELDVHAPRGEAEEDAPPIEAGSEATTSHDTTEESTEETLPEARATRDSVTDSPMELRRLALEARHRGEHRRAVELLSRALDQSSPTDEARADILLELARIHVRQLDDPDAGAGYLRQFVRNFPSDPAAAAAREQLCDIRPSDPVCD